MSNKKPIGGRQDIRDRLFSPVTDPKTRVVETATNWANGEDFIEVAQLPGLAYRLEAAGLLAAAPVVPSVETLRALLMKASSFGSVTVDGCEAIRNHLQTLGWREK